MLTYPISPKPDSPLGRSKTMWCLDTELRGLFFNCVFFIKYPFLFLRKIWDIIAAGGNYFPIEIISEK